MENRIKQNGRGKRLNKKRSGRGKRLNKNTTWEKAVKEWQRGCGNNKKADGETVRQEKKKRQGKQSKNAGGRLNKAGGIGKKRKTT